jgi:DNA polymerase (family 10)
MDKNQVAAIIDEIGTLLELQGENPFKSIAYHNAARAIEQLQGSLPELIASGDLGHTKAIGESIRDKVTTLVNTGHLPYYEELRAKFPAGVFDMLRVQGLGPKKVKALLDELGVDDLDKLKQACDADKVSKLKGFGAKTQQRILEGINFLAQMGQRVRIDQAQPLAMHLLAGLQKCPGIIRMELCGSLRRRRETIKDIDILVSAKDPAPIMDCFVSLPGVEQVLGHGETKSSVIVGNGAGHGRILMNADLRVVSDKEFPFALMYFTGSKEHNIVLRQRAQDHGLKLNEYDLAGERKHAACKDEADIYKVLGLDYIPPEMREDTGEIDAAAHHQIPLLVELDDIRGTFHCHTTMSDGRNSLEEMVSTARSLGWKYYGIADHSQSLTVANGLTPARVRQQQADIDALAKKVPDIKLFKGTECDILPDGSLDFNDEVLASFDYVVASVHTHFSLSEKDMTARIVKAVSHPRVTMLGHATGRLLLSRDGYKVDLEAVLQAAAKHKTMIEINAHPMRLDLDWVHCKRAKALGVQLVINPDAHSTEDLKYIPYGVDVARRGWLEKSDVFNTKTAAQVAKALEARKHNA